MKHSFSMLVLLGLLVLSASGQEPVSQEIYAATAVIRVVFPENATNRYTSEALKELTSTHVQLIQTKPVLYDVMERLLLQLYWGKRYNTPSVPMTRDSTLGRLANHLAVRTAKSLGLIEITFQSPEADECARIANEVASVYIEMSKRAPDQVRGVVVELVDPAEKPTKAIH